MSGILFDRKRTGAVIACAAMPIFAAAALALAAAPAAAAVIFDNGPAIVWDPPISPVSDHDRSGEAADDFVLSPGATTIRGVKWTGDYFLIGSTLPSVNETYAIRIFADAAGLPANAAPLYDFTVTDPIRTSSTAVPDDFDFFVEIPEITLTAGTTYWLSIVNITPPANFSTDSFTWSLSGPGNSAGRSTLLSFPWTSNLFNGESFDLAFQLLDQGPAAVPAPWGLAALAGAALFAFARRRRAAGQSR